MKKLYFIITFLVVVILLFPFTGCTKAKEKVLLISSYHPEFSWVAGEIKGVEDVFKDRGTQIQKFFMDTKRKTDLEWKQQVAANAIMKIEEVKPNLVIVFDDDACEFVAKIYIGEDLPIVFGGLNGDPEEFGFPAKNITGVLERHLHEQTVNLLKSLVPDVKTAAIISDNSTTAQRYIVEMKKSSWPIQILEYYATDDFDAWKAKVKELQSRVDAIGIFTYQTIKEKGQGASLPEEDVMKWTVENSKLPEFTFSDFGVREGALCGVTQSGYQQGKAAAEMAVRILNGETPGDIPIQTPQKGVPIINETRAKQLNIQIPADVLKEVEIMW